MNVKPSYLTTAVAFRSSSKKRSILNRHFPTLNKVFTLEFLNAQMFRKVLQIGITFHVTFAHKRQKQDKISLNLKKMGHIVI